MGTSLSLHPLSPGRVWHPMNPCAYWQGFVTSSPAPLPLAYLAGCSRYDLVPTPVCVEEVGSGQLSVSLRTESFAFLAAPFLPLLTPLFWQSHNTTHWAGLGRKATLTPQGLVSLNLHCFLFFLMFPKCINL